MSTKAKGWKKINAYRDITFHSERIEALGFDKSDFIRASVEKELKRLEKAKGVKNNG